jgi:hypothetical protein
MNTFTVNDPTGVYMFAGNEADAWAAYISDPIAYLELMSWFEWCNRNLEQVILYV